MFKVHNGNSGFPGTTYRTIRWPHNAIDKNVNIIIFVNIFLAVSAAMAIPSRDGQIQLYDFFRPIWCTIPAMINLRLKTDDRQFDKYASPFK
jgi:hypothetical protein